MASAYCNCWCAELNIHIADSIVSAKVLLIRLSLLDNLQKLGISWLE